MIRIVTTADQLVNAELPFTLTKVNGTSIPTVDVESVTVDGSRVLLTRPRTEWAPPFALAATDLVAVVPA